MADRRNPVRNNDFRRIAKLIEHLLNLMLRFHIKRGSRVIHHKNRAFFRQCPCNADTLLLPAGQPDAALSDYRLVLLLHFFDKAARLRVPCRLSHVFHRKLPAFSHLNIFLNRIRKQKYILQYYINAAAKLPQCQRAHIGTVKPHRALICIIKPLQQIDQGRLARTGRPHNPKRMPCRNMKINIC